MSQGKSSFLDFIPVVGPIVSGIADVISGESQNRTQLQMQEREFANNLKMWKMQNEYNTPAAQMKRFKEAGLNPNLVYSQGNAGNAQSAPQYNAPNVHRVDYGSVGKALTETLMNIAQLRNLNAEADKKEAERDGIKVTNRYLDDQFKWRNALLFSNLNASQAENMYKTTYFTTLSEKGVQMAEADALMKLLDKDIKQEYGMKGAKILYDLNSARRQQALAGAKLARMQADYYDARTKWQLDENKYHSNPVDRFNYNGIPLGRIGQWLMNKLLGN